MPIAVGTSVGTNAASGLVRLAALVALLYASVTPKRPPGS